MEDATLAAESVHRIPLVQKHLVEEAVAILCRFPDLVTGVEHTLHLKMPPVRILQQNDVY